MTWKHAEITDKLQIWLKIKELSCCKLVRVGGQGLITENSTNCILWGIFGCHLLPIKVLCLSVLFYIFSFCLLHSCQNHHSSFFFIPILNISAHTLIQETSLTLYNLLWVTYHIHVVCASISWWVCVYYMQLCCSMCWTYEMESVLAAVQRCCQHIQLTAVCLTWGSFSGRFANH